MRLAMPVLFLFMAAAAVAAPTAFAQDGCTPCQCGVAYCIGEGIYMPQVTWTIPSNVSAGEPFNVTYAVSWHIMGDGNESLAWAPGLRIFDPTRPELGAVQFTPPPAAMPRNISTMMVWPEPGRLALQLAADGLTGWQEIQEVMVAPAASANPPPSAGKARDVPAPAGVMPLVVGLLAGASRRW